MKEVHSTTLAGEGDKTELPPPSLRHQLEEKLSEIKANAIDQSTTLRLVAVCEAAGAALGMLEEGLTMAPRNTLRMALDEFVAGPS